MQIPLRNYGFQGVFHMGDVDSVCERAMNHLDLLNVAFSFPMEILVNHPPVITIFIGGMLTIPSHGRFMALFDPHYSQLASQM